MQCRLNVDETVSSQHLRPLERTKCSVWDRLRRVRGEGVVPSGGVCRSVDSGRLRYESLSI